MCQQIIVRKFGACGHTTEIPDDRQSLCLFGEHCKIVNHTHRSFQQRQDQFCANCKRRNAAVRSSAKTGKPLNIHKAPCANDRTSTARKTAAATPLSPSTKTKLNGVALGSLRAYLTRDLCFDECRSLAHFALQQPSFVSKESIGDALGEGAGGWYGAEAESELAALAERKIPGSGRRMQRALARGRELREGEREPETPEPAVLVDAPPPRAAAWAAAPKMPGGEAALAPELEAAGAPKLSWSGIVKIDRHKLQPAEFPALAKQGGAPKPEAAEAAPKSLWSTMAKIN